MGVRGRENECGGGGGERRWRGRGGVVNVR